jgi:hypothetical protein
LLLPDPATIDALAPEQLAPTLAALAALQARIAARLAAEARPLPVPVEPDDLLTVAEAATLTRRSVTWLNHHGHRLPGFSQPGGKGGRKFWARRALCAWMTAGADGAR